MAIEAMSKQSTQVNCQQFAGGGPVVFVRNTFIDVDDCSPSLKSLRGKRRSQTLPVSAHGHIANEELEDIDVDSFGRQSTVESNGGITYTASISSEEAFSPRSSPASSMPLTSATSPKMAKMPPPACMRRPQALELNHDSNGFLVVCWRVEARKLRGSDKQAVSPLFELPLGPSGQSMQLRIMIYPKASASKNPCNFRSSQGKGYIQVKYESDTVGKLPSVKVEMSVGSGNHAQAHRSIHHDFSSNAICGLPRSDDIWDFNSSMELESNMLPIFIRLC